MASLASKLKKQNKTASKTAKSGDVIGHAKATLDPTGFSRSSYSAAVKSSPYDRSENKKSIKQSGKLNEEEYAQREKELAKMRGYDDRYYSDMSKYTGDYVGGLSELQKQAQSDNAYFQNEAKSAMTLAEAGDPNNKVMQSVRDLYDKQAQGVRKNSLQDVGVLNALGAQATAGQMGANGAPMTGSQLQLLNANNQAQSGQAYARAQQQMQALREQGLERGFSESANQYNRGQQVYDRLGGLRNEIGGYDQGIFGARSGLSGLAHGLDTASSQRTLGSQGAYYDARQGNVNANMQNYNAQKDVYQSGVNTYMPPYTGPYGGGGAAAAPQQKPAQQQPQANNAGGSQAQASNNPYGQQDPYYNRNYQYGYGYT